MKEASDILLIETSAARCSVALSRNGTVVASRSDDGRRHASLTAVFCKEVLEEAGLKAEELSAVCISDGPGSYTGLRVGLSTAKGLCFGAGVKLLSVRSLDVLAAMGRDCLEKGWASVPVADRVEYVVPMLDARRMEVYTALYSAASGQRLSPVEAKVVEYGAFASIASKSLFIGDGALKCRELIGDGNFVDALPDARFMASAAQAEWEAGNWRDVAYFEPFYLKDFVATSSKKKFF